MPREAVINRIEILLNEITILGGTQERTSIVPNLTVIDANPTDLTGSIIIQDDRDGDYITAKKIAGKIYANNDLVNVLFVEGTEPIAFQQASESPSGNSLWQVVPSTTTDIFYNNGDVGIGKSVAPDASLEILDTTQAQLRLTHTEDTKFANFTVDTNHDLTIKPSSTGQIILQPTTDQTNSVQVLDADGGTPVVNVDCTNEWLGIRTATPGVPLHVVTDEASSPAWATADIAVFERNGGGRVHLHSSTTSESGLWFTDTVRGRGQINYLHNGDEMRFVTAGSTRMTIESNGEIGIGTTNPGSLMEWNMATDDLEFVDADTSATAVGSIIGVIEVQIAGVTGYVPIYDSFS